MLSAHHTHTCRNTPGVDIRRQRGVSLIELMIAMTITLFIMGVMTTVLVSNSRSRTEIERSSQEIENARYAIQQMTDDLQMAGYWAEFNIAGSALPTPATLPDPCTDASSAANLKALALALQLSVQGAYQYPSTSNPVSCINDVKPGTDVLVVRRASGCAAGVDANCSPPAGVPYFQASACADSSELNAIGVVSGTITPGTPGQFLIDTTTANLTLHIKPVGSNPCNTTAALHQFLVHIYYVANNDKNGDGIPTLKRAELGAGTAAAAWTVTSIAQGVEVLHLDYGINTNGDHMATTGNRMPDVFLADPANTTTSGTAGCTVSSGVVCPSNFANTVAVQINMLVRNPTSTLGYTDGKTYTLGINKPVTVTPGGNYKRHAYTQEVMLWNPAIR